MPSRRLLALMLAPLLAVASSAAAAQSVLGSVVDSASGAPIPGAVVQALDAAGAPRARALTDSRGVFGFRGTADIRQIRIVRIGYLPRLVDLAPPSPDGAIMQLGSIAMRRIPAFLDPVRVVAAQCRGRSNRGQSPIGLIEQARAGLLATIVSRDENPAAMTRITYERRFDRNLDRPTQQLLRLDSATAQTRSFTAVQDAEAFVRRGFVDEIDGAQYFFAPDAEVLLDERFAAGYCFRVMPRDRRRPREIGLGFEAADRVKGRVDVEGALWIDTVARTLQRIEFRYVGLPAAVERQDPGGEISFLTLGNGLVVVDRWELRMIGATTTAVVTGRGQRVQYRGRYIQLHSGGELTSGVWADGTRFQATLGRVDGRARWRDGTPAVGALLAFSNTPYRSAVPADGRYAFEGLIPGRYRVVVVDSTMLSIGLGIPTDLEVTSARDSTSVNLSLPTRADAVADLCRRSGRVSTSSRSAYLLARAIREDGTPIEGAVWTLRALREGEWRDLATDGLTGNDGMMPYCTGLQRGMYIDLVVRAPEGLTDVKRVRLEEAATIVPVVFPRP